MGPDCGFGVLILVGRDPNGLLGSGGVKGDHILESPDKDLLGEVERGGKEIWVGMEPRSRRARRKLNTNSTSSVTIAKFRYKFW